jgi:hypothetical protein
LPKSIINGVERTRVVARDITVKYDNHTRIETAVFEAEKIFGPLADVSLEGKFEEIMQRIEEAAVSDGQNACKYIWSETTAQPGD